MTLWQVQAVTVGLGFAFLILLIELAQERSMVPKTTAEVLIRETWVIPEIAYAISGVLQLGIIAVWLPSDASVAVGFAFVLVPTIVLLIRSYWRALMLLFNALVLRQHAIDLIKERLTASMRSLWVVRRANSILTGAIAEVADFSPLDPPARDSWVVLILGQAGQITDIHAGRLIEAIRALPRVQAVAEAELGESPVSVSESTERVLLRTLVGDRVEVDRAFLFVPKSLYAIAGPLFSLDGIVRLRHDAQS